ncbi:MAG TPA: hypothetical protein ENJ55_03235, partial [Rhizobiales bacterium]|nr:hypothetical protein [Hyphomicrobiales bacterium]
PRTLNGEGRFIEFETLEGIKSFISKQSISETIPNNIPKKKKLDAGTDSDKDFNPYRILKIAPGSDAQTVKTAYFTRAKLYHPDRFSTIDMPEEMIRYAENMSRLINAAYQSLCAMQDDPVCESQPPITAGTVETA